MVCVVLPIELPKKNIHKKGSIRRVQTPSPVKVSPSRIRIHMDDFQNIMGTFVSIDTSAIKFSQRFDQLFVRDTSQIVEKMSYSRNVEESFKNSCILYSLVPPQP